MYHFLKDPSIIGDGLKPLSSPLTFTGLTAQFSPTIPGDDGVTINTR